MILFILMIGVIMTSFYLESIHIYFEILRALSDFVYVSSVSVYSLFKYLIKYVSIFAETTLNYCILSPQL